MVKKKTLKDEAEDFTKQKQIRHKKSLTTRDMVAMQVMSGLISGANGRFHVDDIKREAYLIADKFLEQD